MTIEHANMHRWPTDCSVCLWAKVWGREIASTVHADVWLLSGLVLCVIVYTLRQKFMLCDRGGKWTEKVGPGTPEAEKKAKFMGLWVMFGWQANVTIKSSVNIRSEHEMGRKGRVSCTGVGQGQWWRAGKKKEKEKKRGNIVTGVLLAGKNYGTTLMETYRHRQKHIFSLITVHYCRNCV